MMRRLLIAGLMWVVVDSCSVQALARGDSGLQGAVEHALKKAATYYRTKVARHGGYVYYYSLDLTKRLGEGVASDDQIWVQPPGTPTVGMAFVKAFEATGDRFYLDAATAAAEALMYGQLKSGGWQNAVDFNPRGSRVQQYRNGKGGKTNNSTLDDDQSQSALRFLMRVDRAHEFKQRKVHEAVEYGLNALLKAQFPNGGFPQVWTGPVNQKLPVVKAQYPAFDWRDETRKIKDYWTLYTLNDGLAGTVSATLSEAYDIYKDEKYKLALAKLGDFLVLAQMPEPQPGWAQQYNFEMEPVWARKFEPAAIAGRESKDAVCTLMNVYRVTRDPKYLESIPAAIAYLRRSVLPDGKLARYYELKTNRPLYMEKKGKEYSPTFDASKGAYHYGWKDPPHLDELESEFKSLQSGGDTPVTAQPSPAEIERHVRQIVAGLDTEGRWISIYQGEPLVGQPNFARNEPYIHSGVFSENIETLSAYLAANSPPSR